MIKKLANIFHSHSILIKRFITGRKKRIFFTPVRIALGILGVVIGSVLVYFFLLHGNGASASWWNDGWKYRKSVTISNTSTALTDYQAMITLDTATLITAGKMQSDCDDIRIVSHNGEQYNYWIEPTTCNTSATKIWTKVKSIPSTGGVVYIYYGNTGASSVAKSPSEIFIQEIDNVGAAWLLDESSANSCTGGVNDSCDSSTSSFDLAWGTATTSTTGKISNGLNFDGTDNATANIDDTFTPISSTKRWTVALWFKTSDTQGYLFDTGDGGNVGERVAVFSDGANNLSLYMSQDSNGTEYKYLNYSVTSTDNNWHHLVVTRDGDNSVKLYVDSSVISVSSTTTDVDMSSYSETWTDFNLGHRYILNIYNYTGVIDEARVYTDSLTAAEISALYGDGTNRHGYVTANYANKELIRQYSANVSVGSPASEEIGPGPSGYWKFDEGYGTSVNDSSGDNHTGNLGTGSSAPTWKSEESCVNGNCFQFDGTDDSINFGDVLDFTGNTEMTVSAWIRLTSAPSSRGQIISKYDAGTSGQWYFGVDGQKKVVFLRECGSYGITGNNALSLSTWNHVSGVYDGTNLKIYVNGILDETAVDSCSISNTSVDTVIGAGDNGTGTEDHFPGFIDEVKVYPYARSADEIKQDYLFSSAQGSAVVLGAQDTSFLSNGLVGYWKMDETTGTSGPSWTAIDSSGSGRNGTGAENAVVTSGKFGNGGGLDGSGDYLDMGDQTEHDLTFPFTLSAWINISQLPSVKGSDSEIMSKYGGAGTRQWTLGIGTDNVLYFFKSHNGTNGEYGVISGHEFTSSDVNVWRHVVYSVDSQGVANMYVDGSLVESYTFSNTTIYTGASTSMRIGARALNSNYFKGTIDEARIYSRALTSSEVKSLYQWAPGPIMAYNFEEGTGTGADIVKDITGNGKDMDMHASMTNSNWTNGKFGGGMKLDGGNNVLDIDNWMNTVPSGLTMMAWVKFDSLDTSYSNNGFEIMEDGCCTKYSIYVSNAGRPETYVGGQNTFGSNGDIVAGQWYHLASIYDGSSVKLFLNGVLISTNSSLGSLSSPSSTMYVGGRGSNNQTWPGSIDEVKFYNYARSTSQIIEDMNAGHPLGGSPVGSQLTYWRMDEGYGDYAYDSIGNSDSWLGGGDSCPGTATCPTWTNDGKFGKALSFDGGDYMEAEAIAGYDNNGTGSYTATLWFKSNTNPTNNYALMGIVSNFGGNQDRFLQVTSTGVPRFYVYDGVERYATGTTDVIDNTWHHLAGVFDGTTIYIYVDGKLEDTAATTGSENHTNPYIRFSHQVTSYYDHTVGILDEAKIYTTALTAEQILLDMNQGRSLVLGSTSTGVGGTSPSNSAGREYCVPGDTTTCSAPFGEWLFNEGSGSIAYDTSRNGYNGTLGSDITTNDWTSGKVGKGINFSGNSTNDVVVVNNGASVRNKSQISLEMWIKPSVVGTYSRAMYGETISGSGSNRFSFYITSAGALSLGGRTWDGGSFNTWVSTSNGLITADNWYHVVGVFNSDSNLHKIYINGQLSNSNSADYSAFVDTAPQSGPHIGGQGFLSINEMFRGTIDQVRIYDYERTPAQISWTYSKGAPVAHYRFDECQGTTVHDVTGNGYNATMSIGGSGTSAAGTCNTSSSAWGNGATGKWNASLDLDGSDDYLATGSTVPELAGLTEMSVCSWIKYGPGSVTADGVIVGQYSGSPPGWLLWVDDVGAVFGETDTVSFSPNPVGGSAGRVEGTTGLVSTGVWDHYCGVFKGGSFIRLYKNGVLNAENTSSIVSVADVPDTVLQIGRWTNFNNSYFDGQIDDIRIYNYALTSHQVKEVYGGGAVVFK